MSVLKVIEILASSEKSWEEAVQNAVTTASKSLKGIRSVYVQDHEFVSLCRIHGAAYFAL